MILYAESSAVMSWVLAQERASDVGDALAEAALVISSDLTMLECERVLVRGSIQGGMPEVEIVERGQALRTAAQYWMLLGFSIPVLERAQRPFPEEPVRTLDALHLAFALEAQRMVPGLRLLSLDRRIRESARRLGMEVVPD